MKKNQGVMDVKPQVSVLFVCMGNICRSPTAHGVFRRLVAEANLLDRIEIDSAGTHAYHVGERPDPRACETALGRGLDIRDLRARCVEAADFHAFDYVVAMDADNHAHLARLCPPGLESKLSLLMDFAPDFPQREVPDPYYGGRRGFDQVFDMVEEAARGLLDDVRQRLGD